MKEYEPTTSIVPAMNDTLSQLRTVANVLAPDLNDQELQLFAMVAARSGLDPFARQIYAVKRKGRVTFQTGIDGYRSIAVRTGEYDGQDEPEYGPDCPCSQKPQKHPVSATVRVYRKGMSRPVAASAFWHEYNPDEGFMWQKMPHVMIAKVAEALALRKAFPWDPNAGQGIGADLYTADEMEQADTPPVKERLRQRRAVLAEPMPTVQDASGDDAWVPADETDVQRSNTPSGARAVTPRASDIVDPIGSNSSEGRRQKSLHGRSNQTATSSYEPTEDGGPNTASSWKESSEGRSSSGSQSIIGTASGATTVRRTSNSGSDLSAEAREHPISDVPIAGNSGPASSGIAPTGGLTQREFQALAKDAAVSKEQMLWAAETIAPGTRSSDVTEAQWYAMAELLALTPPIVVEGQEALPL